MEAIISNINITDININNHRRTTNPAKIKELAESIKEIGLINPITVARQDEKYQLIAGLHRLEAYRYNGECTIPAIVDDKTDELLLKLKEIDENLIRNELHYIERGEHLEKRDEILRELGLRAKSGTNLKNLKTTGELNSPVKTTALIAKEAGISERVAQQEKQIAKSLTPTTKEKAIKCNITKQDAIKLSHLKPDEQEQVITKIADGTAKNYKESIKLLKQEKKESVSENLPPITDRYKILHGDIASIDNQIQSGSIDTVLTDPPYGREYLHLYEILAKKSKEWLKPGGSLLVMCGQSYLTEILNLMTPHLQYNWVVAYLTPGGQSAQLWDRNVNTFWKPVLWFTNGKYEGDWIGDVVRSDVNDNDKRFHEWGQSESGMAELVKRFSDPGNTILDPFLGGGTTGVVAISMNRKFVGIDVDEEAVTTSLVRLNNLYVPLNN